MEPLAHQKPAYDELVARATAFYRGSWRKEWEKLGIGVHPRWHTLLAAPTGVGKSALCGMVAAASEAKMLKINANSWMPCGAHNRGTRETVSVIAEAVAQNNRTLLVIDEGDKIFSHKESSWHGFILGELYSILDSTWPTGLKQEDGDPIDTQTLESLTRKLKETVFILLIGTFQEFFDQADSANRRTIGFGNIVNGGMDGDMDDNQSAVIGIDTVASVIPRELTNRIHSQIVRLPQLRPSDYHNIARQTADTLPERLRSAFRDEVCRQIGSAIEAKKGVRFLEEVVMTVLKNLPEEPEETKPEKPNPWDFLLP